MLHTNPSAQLHWHRLEAPPAEGLCIARVRGIKTGIKTGMKTGTKAGITAQQRCLNQASDCAAGSGKAQSS